MNKKETIWVSQYDYQTHEFKGTSEKPYAIWHLLDLVDEATAWDCVVLEETYTASDVLESLAYWLNVESENYENLDLLFGAVEDSLR